MHRTLVSVAELAARHKDADWVVFDCRHDLADVRRGQAAFAAGHIAGSVFAHLDDDLSGAKSGSNGRHPIPDAADFINFLRRSGVSPATQIVAYDSGDGMFAARLWWLARWIGHDAVAVLDGGLAAWTAAGNSLSQAASARAAGQIVLKPSLTPVHNVTDILAHLSDAAFLVIDARAPARYRGEIEPLDAVAGHIPGARNRFYQQNLDTDGRFKSATALRHEFALVLKGQPVDSSIVHQCGSGVTACHNLLAMEIAGMQGTALYPGSWSEWSADDARPIAIGPAT